MKPVIRMIAAVSTGLMSFILINGFICWVLTFLKIGPYGKFVATFIKGKTPDEAKAFAAANQELLSQMLPAASKFSNLFISPVSALLMGIIVGLIMYSKKIYGVVWSLIIISVPAGLYWTKSASDPDRVFYFAILLIVAALGGLIGNVIASKTFNREMPR